MSKLEFLKIEDASRQEILQYPFNTTIYSIYFGNHPILCQALTARLPTKSL